MPREILRHAVRAVVLCAIGAGAVRAQAPAERADLERLRDSLGAVADSQSLKRLEAGTIDVAKHDRENPLIHLRLGFIAYRLGEIAKSKPHYDDAAGEFEWATELKPDWPYPWYGLGLAELAQGENSSIAIENLRQQLGLDYLSKAARAFAHAAQADPSFAFAAVDLANAALTQRIRPRLEVAQQALRLAAASPAGANPAVQLARGRVEREMGDSNTTGSDTSDRYNCSTWTRTRLVSSRLAIPAATSSASDAAAEKSVPHTIGALWFFFIVYRSSSVQEFLTSSKTSSDLFMAIHLWVINKTDCSDFWQSQSSSSFGKQKNTSHPLKCFCVMLHWAKTNVCFVSSVALMDHQIFVNGCSRSTIPCVVMAMLSLYSSTVLLEVSAQSTPGGGGGLPSMPIPADNPQSEAKGELGRQLYFDGRLSANNEISCATCHAPKDGWAGHDATDTGVGGRVGNRNSGTIVNSGYMKYQFWDGRAASLEEQALGPIHNPVEMGETLENVVRKLNAIHGYKRQFQDVFHSEVTTDGIAKAIAAFERTIVSGPSPYDRFLQGDKKALSAEALRGMEIFNGKGTCIACHNGPVFSDQSFHNLGIGMNAAKPDVGRETVTKDEKDRGKFKTPGLRNVANTYPYMHDGQTPTLEAVIELHNKGGISNSNLDPLIKPLGLTDTEKKDLLAFLKALTGPEPIVNAPKLP